MFEDTNISGKLNIEYTLEDGDFILDSGFIVSWTGTIRSGASIGGTCTINADIHIANLTLINADLIIVNTPIYTIFSWYLFNSSLFLNTTVLSSGPSIEGYGMCNITIRDGKLDAITIESGFIDSQNSFISSIYIEQSGNITIDNTSVSTIYVANGAIDILNSNVSDIVIKNGELHIYNSYVSDDITLGDFEYILRTGPCNVNLEAYNSTLHDIYAAGLGLIKVDSCTVNGSILSFFHNIQIIDSIVNASVRGYLYTSGTVVIENNVLPDGYTELLNVSGTSVVYNYMDGVVGLEQSSLSLTLLNSSYFGLVCLGGDINVTKSSLSIAFLLTNKTIYVYNSEINASIIGNQAPSLFGFEDVSIINSTLECGGAYVMGHHNVLFDSVKIVTDLYIANTSGTLININIMNRSINIENSSVSIINSQMNGTKLQSRNSTIILEDATLKWMEIFDTTINATRTTILDTADPKPVLLYGKSTFAGSDVTLFEIGLGCSYDFYYGVEIPSRYISWTLTNSKVIYAYSEYYYVDNAIGATFINDVVSGAYESKTKHISTDTSSAFIRRVQFNIEKTGKANISGYIDKPIKALWVSITPDTTKPIITPSNGTYSFEYRLSTVLNITIHDESPGRYSVVLNYSQILCDDYTPDEVIIIDLASIVPGPGTYTLTVSARDAYNNYCEVKYTIIAHPALAPILTVKPNATYSLALGEELDLVWIANDVSPYNYTLSKNNVIEMSGPWESGEEIRYHFVAEEAGTYNITITFYDQLFNTTSHTVMITVSGTTTTGISTTKVLAIFATVAIIIVVAILLLRKKK